MMGQFKDRGGEIRLAAHDLRNRFVLDVSGEDQFRVVTQDRIRGSHRENQRRVVHGPVPLPRDGMDGIETHPPHEETLSALDGLDRNPRGVDALEKLDQARGSTGSGGDEEFTGGEEATDRHDVDDLRDAIEVIGIGM